MSDTQERVVGNGSWSERGVPHRGWTCVDVEDLEEPSEVCEMCRTAVIRYVHTMQHPEYPKTLRCGCVCAENMSQDYVGPKLRERELHNAANRRKALAAHKNEVRELIKAKRELKRKIAALGSVFRKVREAAVWVDAGGQMLANPGLDDWGRRFVSDMVERFEDNPCFEPTERQAAYFVKLCRQLGVVPKEEEQG